MKILILTISFALMQIFSSSQDESEKKVEIEFEGIYRTGRGPCQWLADGSRRWAKTSGFSITKVIKGDIKVKYIEISQYCKKTDRFISYKYEQKYRVLLSLTEERLKALELDDENTVMDLWQSIETEEIVKVEEIMH